MTGLMGKQILRKMENKYYTPEEKEFHQGFRFQLNYLKEGWLDEVFDGKEPSFHSIGQLKYGLMKHDWDEKVRVKHLDRSDIEEAGWTFSNFSKFYFHTSTGIDDDEKAAGHGIWLQQHGTEWTIIDCRMEFHKVLFRGQIKNYNKLLDVMEMLNIKK